MNRCMELGFGGGCHWCTEAVFQAVRGVVEVRQGFLSTRNNPEAYSEGVWIRFDPDLVSPEQLIDIHLITHSSASNHRMRAKYRSAVYWNDPNQSQRLSATFDRITGARGAAVVTRLFELGDFRDSPEMFRNYYFRNPSAPFCQTHIEPKLKGLLRTHPQLLKEAAPKFEDP